MVRAMITWIGLGILAAALIIMLLVWWPVYKGDGPEEGNGAGIRTRYY